jgi:hypothetical protein
MRILVCFSSCWMLSENALLGMAYPLLSSDSEYSIANLFPRRSKNHLVASIFSCYFLLISMTLLCSGLHRARDTQEYVANLPRGFGTFSKVVLLGNNIGDAPQYARGCSKPWML